MFLYRLCDVSACFSGCMCGFQAHWHEINCTQMCCFSLPDYTGPQMCALRPCCKVSVTFFFQLWQGWNRKRRGAGILDLKMKMQNRPFEFHMTSNENGTVDLVLIWILAENLFQRPWLSFSSCSTECYSEKCLSLGLCTVWTDYTNRVCFCNSLNTHTHTYTHTHKWFCPGRLNHNTEGKIQLSLS